MSRECSQQGENAERDECGRGITMSEGTSQIGVESGETFGEQSFPENFRAIMRKTFEGFEQGHMTVSQYAIEFQTLSRVAPDPIVSEKAKCELFERRLDPILRVLVAGHEIGNFAELVAYTVAIEAKWKELLEVKRTWVWRPKSSPTEVSSSSVGASELGKKRERENVQPSQRRLGHKPLFPLAKPGMSLRTQIVCHKCGESGHFRNKCPKSGISSSKCYACGQPGHVAKSCPLRGTKRGRY